MNAVKLQGSRILPLALALLLYVLLTANGAAQVQARPRSSGFAEVNGTKLYYETAGRGRTLVFVHGGLVDSRLRDDQFEEFAKHYRTIRYDLRGFGKSETPTTAFSHIADLHAPLGFLKVERATIVGLSLGGMVATDFALEHPEMVETLVLVGAGLRGYNAPPNEQVVALYRTARADGADKYAENWLATQLFAASRDKPQVRERMLRMLRDNYKTVPQLTDQMLEFPKTITSERLPTLRVPTLVVVGSEDHRYLLEVADILQTRIRGAQRVVIRGASHHPNIEQPRDFNRVVLSFLQKVNSTKQGALAPA